MGDGILNQCIACSDGTPNKTNYRYHAKKSMDLAAKHKPWFGIEVCWQSLASSLFHGILTTVW
jgi:hypothetical protein